MKIGNDWVMPTNVATARADGSGRGERTDAAGGRAESAGFDRVELSLRRTDMGRIREELANTPDVRAEKVEALRKAVADGTYRVDGGLVAQRMLETYRRFADGGDDAGQR